MNEIALQKTMTTKELADTLHVDRRTINKKLKMVRSCKGDASQIKVGVPSHITEVEAVEIKKSLGIHNLERSFQGTVKAYHVDVWEGIYYDSINYPQ